MNYYRISSGKANTDRKNHPKTKQKIKNYRGRSAPSPICDLE